MSGAGFAGAVQVVDVGDLERRFAGVVVPVERALQNQHFVVHQHVAVLLVEIGVHHGFDAGGVVVQGQHRHAPVAGIDSAHANQQPRHQAAFHAVALELGDAAAGEPAELGLEAAHRVTAQIKAERLLFSRESLFLGPLGNVGKAAFAVAGYDDPAEHVVLSRRRVAGVLLGELERPGQRRHQRRPRRSEVVQSAATNERFNHATIDLF